jgi:hypothetical protein
MISHLDSLPDELLELILHHATSSLRADSNGDSDILHRAASWSSLVSVNRRRAVVSVWPQSLECQQRMASHPSSGTPLSSTARPWDARFADGDG